jgi:hypothetical protein
MNKKDYLKLRNKIKKIEENSKKRGKELWIIMLSIFLTFFFTKSYTYYLKVIPQVPTTDLESFIAWTIIFIIGFVFLIRAIFFDKFP